MKVCRTLSEILAQFTIYNHLSLDLCTSSFYCNAQSFTLNIDPLIHIDYLAHPEGSGSHVK